MTRIFIIILISLTVACSTESNEEKQSSTMLLTIEEANFIKKPEYGKITFDKLADDFRSELPIDRISEKEGAKYLYLLYKVSQIEVKKDYSVGLFYLVVNDNLGLDVFIEKYYVVTFDAKNKAISSLEVGTYEEHFGLEILMTSTIFEQLEIRTVTTKTEDDDDSDKSLVSKSEDNYKITDSGEIVKSK
jgi:hypothetical protein